MSALPMPARGRKPYSLQDLFREGLRKAFVSLDRTIGDSVAAAEALPPELCFPLLP